MIDHGVRGDPKEPATEGIVAELTAADRDQSTLEGHRGQVLRHGRVTDASGDEAVDPWQILVVQFAERSRIDPGTLDEGALPGLVRSWTGAGIGSHPVTDGGQGRTVRPPASSTVREGST